ncbi:hypothetical protein EVAR_16554_1 [Eumeta japonica]|uniref:Uncharacterized protein n=1 Tax=Eumeta variegata TaxID=151549 RepID=A0A4C1U312_EUMVA|nr:hypothetical protein EVAR_16554_1 [Eumeta japonica]
MPRILKLPTDAPSTTLNDRRACAVLQRMEDQMSMRAMKKQMVTIIHGYSQPQRSHQVFVGFLGRNTISDEEGKGLMDGKGVE